MGQREPTVRLDLTFARLEALAWAVWFSAPAARQDDVAALDEVAADLLKKRRQFRTSPLPQQSQQNHLDFTKPGADPEPGGDEQ